MDDRSPVLVGWAQATARDEDPAAPIGPLERMEACARDAACASGAGDRLLASIDRLCVVDAVGWRWQNGPRLLADRLGARPAELVQTALGGNMPSRFLNDAARRIAAGECRAVLLAGAESINTLLRARKRGVMIDWEKGGEGEPIRFGESKPGTSELENRAGLAFPPQVYPLFENAIRARRGEPIAVHRERIGRLMARNATVAAASPHAWFRTARSAEEIVRVDAVNRMIAFPYTKLMNAILDVDQAAAVLLTSAAHARSLGVPEERFVWWWGGGDAIEEAWFPTERPDLSRAPALRVAGAQALAEAGISIDEVSRFDLYSCFPCAIEMACEALDVAEDDPRGLTVTGGLAYAGGPGNAYTVMSLASMAEALLARPGAIGVVTGVGWYMTRHSVGVWASAPPRRAVQAAPPFVRAEPAPAVPVTIEASGPATIETYTVLHGRDGAPERGIVLARLGDGRRVLANTARDRALFEALEREEAVGRHGTVSAGDPVARFEPA